MSEKKEVNPKSAGVAEIKITSKEVSNPGTSDILKRIILFKQKLNDLSLKIKSITDQGRLAKEDGSNFFIFKGMYKKLESYFDSYQKVWDDLLEIHVFNGRESEFPTKAESSTRQNVERYYYESCSIYVEHEELTTKSPNIDPSLLNATLLNESKVVQSRSHLPRLNIPKFDGLLENWPVFRDTFKSIVHDDRSIGDIEKFHHLITLLSGSALSLVKGIPLLGENYNQAWLVLRNVYDDPRKLANKYLQQVIDCKPLHGKPSAESLRMYISSIVENINSLKNLKIPDLAEFILFNLAIRGLDTNTRELFEIENVDVNYPKFEDLSTFVRKRCRVLEISTGYEDQRLKHEVKSTSFGAQIPKRPQYLPIPKDKTQSFITTRSGYQTNFNSYKQPKPSTIVNKPNLKPTYQETSTKSSNNQLYEERSNFLKCCVCEGRHILSICPIFISASAKEKLKLIEGIMVCRNCLFYGHKINDCKSLRNCRICNLRHHTSLHLDPIKPNYQTENKSQHESNSKSSVLTSITTGESEVLLGTAIALLEGSTGEYKQIRLLLDSASQHSFITQSCIKKLGLIPTKSFRCISGLNQAEVKGVNGKVICHLKPLDSAIHQKELLTEALVVPSISNDLPSTRLPQKLRISYNHYQVADPEFWKPGPVDMLIGADLYCEVVNGCPINLKPNEPSLLPTLFGYVLIGRYNSKNVDTSLNFYTHTSDQMSQDPLSTEIKRFWELEEPVVKDIPLSSDEQYCEDHYQVTHQRNESGRYIVMLPFKCDNVNLGDSRQRALSRLMNLENKLKKSPQIKTEYINFMDEYIQLGHMEKTITSGNYYIPHHSITKYLETGIKLRVVFDASAPATNGSLNDYLLPGPKLQQDICNIILNFRIPQFVFTTDIKKMFRQVLVHPQCRKFLHILWRQDPSKEVEEFELSTLIYGINCAPYLAIKTLQQLVKDEGQNYPLASNALLYDTYVDDICTGADSIQQALLIKKQLIELLGKGCFELSKWCSNSSQLLSEGDTNCLVNLSTDDNVKILGFQWDPRNDLFSYVIKPFSNISTKRSILSAIARIYDPLGYLAPVIFYAKSLFQSLWMHGCDWDDPIPPDVFKDWTNFTSQISHLIKLRIPRLITSSEPYKIQVIGFSDASTKGYCGVLYVRLITEQEIKTFIIKSKTKLAPIKTISVPRLELCGALILSRLLQSIIKLITRLNIIDIILFTDSTIVLNWLHTSPNLLNVFVANRVTEIIEATNISSWRHVNSGYNPADLGSRGLLPNDLMNNNLWWNGPSWLRLSEDYWPINVFNYDAESLPELKKAAFTALSTNSAESSHPSSNDSELIHWMETFSSYPKLIRTFAFILRFIRPKTNNQNKSITAEEFFKANLKCIQLIQSHYYKDFDKPKSRIHQQLLSLAPFYDNNKILRVGGRLKNSKISSSAKYPILLPKNAHFTRILIDYYHLMYLHVGPSTLQALIQTRYWIQSARRLIRQRTHNCLTCFRYSGKPQPPIMADLPSIRFEESGPFDCTGVDFFGPLSCKESLLKKSRITKAYVCLFICLSTKAVHLEVVQSLSTRDFLDALDRFIARRGKPSLMVSDCGTNFMGAVNYIKDVADWLKTNDTRSSIIDNLTKQGIEWKFNPPRAPHFGGLWEAGVKQAKILFKKVIGNRNLTIQELNTIFSKIEAVMNSRPISPTSSDPNDPYPLTPGHFLIGRPMTSLPEPDIISEKENRLCRWQIIQQRTQEFWNRWRLEYLQTLQNRLKWRTTSNNITIGEVVLLMEDNAPPLTWPTGIITNIYPGKDSMVRVIEVKTSKGVYKRPVMKVVSLKHIIPNSPPSTN